MTIRKANVSDSKSLSLIAERTFRDTFGGVNSTENMEIHCKCNYSELIQASEIENSNMSTLLCEHESVIVGFAQVRWGDAPVCIVAHRPGEIQRMYFDKIWHGKGLAQMLMKACLNEMSARRNDVAWLGVWERNPRAIAFYKKFGFKEVGDHIFLLGNDQQRDIVMNLPLSI